MVAPTLVAGAMLGMAGPASASSSWPSRIYNGFCTYTKSGYYLWGSKHCWGYFYANSQNYVFAQNGLGYCPRANARVNIDWYYAETPGDWSPPNSWFFTGYKLSQ